MTKCPICGREFDNEIGMKTHKSLGHDRIDPWKDETTLRYLYVKKRFSAAKIAEVLPCDETTVKRWLNRHDLIRSQSRAAKIRVHRVPPHHRWHKGYEQVVTDVNGDQKGVQIHRLVAVAEYGFDEVCDRVVHHKNGVKWDNRPENLEPMTIEEHNRHHLSERGALTDGDWE